MKKKFVIFILIVIILGIIFCVINNKRENDKINNVQNTEIEKKSESYIGKIKEMQNEVTNIQEEKKEEVESNNEKNDIKEVTQNTTKEGFVKDEKIEDVEKVEIEDSIINLNKLYKATSANNSGITFLDNEKFEFILGNEGKIKGEYRIENNAIICNAKTEIKLNEKDKVIAGELVFKITDSKLTLITISVKGTSITLNEKVGIKTNMVYEN